MSQPSALLPQHSELTVCVSPQELPISSPAAAPGGSRGPALEAAPVFLSHLCHLVGLPLQNL